MLLTKQVCKKVLLMLWASLAVAHGMAQVADGLPAGVKKIKDEDAYTTYAVYNDDKAVYIKVFIADSMQKRKVLKNGMEVWVDIKGRKNKNTGILFPMSVTGNFTPGGGDRNAAGGPPPFFSPTGGGRTDTANDALVAKRKNLELKGFAADVNGTKNIGDMPAGLTVGLQMAGDTLVYSATIATSLLASVPAAGQTVSIGILEKGIEMPGFDGGMEGGPGGDGGPPPGGDGGPPPGPPPGDMRNEGPDFGRLFQTNVIWYKLKWN